MHAPCTLGAVREAAAPVREIPTLRLCCSCRSSERKTNPEALLQLCGALEQIIEVAQNNLFSISMNSKAFCFVVVKIFQSRKEIEISMTGRHSETYI
jgi:hypothetical protein